MVRMDGRWMESEAEKSYIDIPETRVTPYRPSALDAHYAAVA